MVIRPELIGPQRPTLYVRGFADCAGTMSLSGIGSDTLLLSLSERQQPFHVFVYLTIDIAMSSYMRISAGR